MDDFRSGIRRISRSLVLPVLSILVTGTSLVAQPMVDDDGDVGIGTLQPDPSALLELSSTRAGFLLPRMSTAQRDGIPAPALGLMIYNTDDGTPQIWSDASGVAKWDTLVTTGSNAGWLTIGNGGLTNGVNNFLGTLDAVPIRIVTLGTERIRVDANGRTGINETSPSARLDVVGGGGIPAIEASNSGGTIAIQGVVDGGSGLILGSIPAIHGDNDDETGAAGTSGSGVGMFGASSSNHGVNGLSLGVSVAGVFGRNDQAGGFGVIGQSVGGGTGVLGESTTGPAGRFQITNAVSTADAVVIGNAGVGDGLEVTATGGGVGIDLNGGELDGDDRGNALGDGSVNQQLTVRGTANAIVGNTLAGNPTAWDLVVQGDVVATGIYKSGGSLWIDGVSATHSVTANAPFDIETVGANSLSLSTNNINAVLVDGTTQDVAVLNSLGVNGMLNVVQATTLNSTLDVNGITSLNSALNVNGHAELNATLNVDGAASFTNTMTQTGGQVTFNGNVDALNGLDVSGSDLTVALNATINGTLTGNSSGNALGSGTANQQLTVRGTADASLGNTLAGNPNVWDLVVQGDAVTTGLLKVGGSLWFDGVSVPHQVHANNPLNITTSVGNIVVNSAAGTTTIDDDLVVTGNLSVSGPFSLPSLTQGSVLFAGAGGTISQDNTNFFFDDASNRLGVGTAAPGTRIDVLNGGTDGGVRVQMTNGGSGSRGIDVSHAGIGEGVFSTSTGGTGVEGITSSISAAGVIGRNTFGEAVVGLNRGGNGVGAVVGRNDSSGYGVRGFNTKNGYGVIGQAGISGGTGVGGRFENINAGNVSTALEVASNGIGSGISVGLSNSSNGGRGIDVTQSGVGPGVFSTSTGGNGVWGITSSISAAGVIGDNTFGEAVVGRNRGGLGVGAVVGRNDSSGYGVRGFNTKNGYGVIGQAGISGGTGVAGRFENVNAANTSDALQVVTNSAGNAARFTGNVVVTGNLTVSGSVAKGGGSFMIDHPLDPENRILYHSFVESPDMKNINDGVVQLDEEGEAWISLPEWFEALNGDFRYQLTAIGAPGPGLYIAEEIRDNRFRIAGGTPGMKVSWMVTGIRHDPWAEKHRIQVEVDKAHDARGTYLHPDAYGVAAPAIQLLGSEVRGEKDGVGAASGLGLSSNDPAQTAESRTDENPVQVIQPSPSVPVASDRVDLPAPTTSTPQAD